MIGPVFAGVIAFHPARAVSGRNRVGLCENHVALLGRVLVAHNHNGDGFPTATTLNSFTMGDNIVPVTHEL